MCEFMRDLVEKKFEEGAPTMDLQGLTYRQFEPIRFGVNLWLSVQASYGHYCRPRTTLSDLNEYTHWEFALFTENDFIRVTEVLPDFPSLAEIELYEQQVYAYVPTDLLEELYLALKHY